MSNDVPPLDGALKTILVADDDPISIRILAGALQQEGYEVIQTADGDQAWERINAPNSPHLIILDWMMPGTTGPELCTRIRSKKDLQIEPYIVILTARSDNRDIVAGLDAGADDYLVKPFDRDELKARIRAGRRIVGLQLALQERIRQIRDAQNEISTLRKMISICMYCKKVYNDDESWQQLESYVENLSHVEFSHKICPNCRAEKHPELEDELVS